LSPRHLAPARAILVLFSLAWLVSACGAPSPEELVRHRISEAEAAAESGRVDLLAGMISDRFRDPGGLGKAGVLALLRARLDPRASIHLLTRVREVRRTEEGAVEATLLVAAASVPIRDPGELPALDADLLRFALVFEEERGEWRLTRAAWRNAGLTDFL